ncbi:PREDICTED: UBP1-associated protein 2A-like [Tarenaya hassleriana]|uniref:UBP1-associated protein 2A-like n=1 Tax=Tarenaya hassleriana TaxID=28532 RepID=UPI00053C2832|nr:PREDICTED: UBP1-associated protein 2A-like [Tarenaya hassleriana]XP_010525453.1 PREDICTED: UBP1-associated protein 2A-like [Tarenaya hassleriana]XP_010525454.1 PREDICTED: UBP1-associated protein 2A-like [Tarenaya hassleriana]
MKRMLEPESTQALETPQKQRKMVELPQEIGDRENQGDGDEDVEYEEVEEEHEEEVDDDDDDPDEDGGGGSENQTVGFGTEAATSGSGNQGGEEDDEPIQNLLEPFTKDQLIILLKEAAGNHPDVANQIRKVADEDPVHRKIFVHGLGWDTKADALIEAFKQYGEIEDCKAVVDKISGKSKGYGFILFKSRSGARNALKQPQKKIGSRMTACQLASVGPVQGNPTAAATSAPAQHSTSEFSYRKIYVSNVAAELDAQKLFAFFSRYGEIEEGPLGLDKVTGRPKGFCLFIYKSPESAKRALDEPHKNFEGHVLHCQKAIDGPKPGKQHHHNSRNHNPRYQRNDNSGYSADGGHGHLMAGNQAGMAAPPTQALNPALGQALTALLAAQGAGLGLHPAMGQALLGSLGTATGVNPAAVGGMPAAYGTQANITQGVIPGYGAQAGLQGGYPSQQPGQGGAGRGQHGGQYGAPYMGH